MPTDPFVAETADVVRNEPNLAPGVVLPPARDWRANRPGELVDGVQPTGGLFGSPGPNVGYALHLVRRLGLDLELAPHEELADVEAVIAALAMKRAASFGRAPVAADIHRAVRLLGYDGSGDARLVEWRVAAVEGAHHEYGVRRAVVDAIPAEALRTP